MLVYISLVLLSATCILLALTCRSLRRDLERDHFELWEQVDTVKRDFFRNDRCLEEKIKALQETMAAAEDLIKEHAELEKEAVKSEQLFQEGLANILSYGVVKNE